jgi:hypothetical protein
MKNGNRLLDFLHGRRVQRELVWGMLILVALLAFELFNYSTTEFAMADLLGDLRFAGIRWATILAIAFCVIDFAGIARLFTPEKDADEPAEVWYLFGAWMLAAGMNAVLTWWGISIAIVSHDMLGKAILPDKTLVRAVPVVVALIVWLIRVLIIGSFSIAGDRFFSQSESSTARLSPVSRRAAAQGHRVPNYQVLAARGVVSAKAARRSPSQRSSKPDLNYKPVQMRSRNNRDRVGSSMG